MGKDGLGIPIMQPLRFRNPSRLGHPRGVRHFGSASRLAVSTLVPPIPARIGQEDRFLDDGTCPRSSGRCLPTSIVLGLPWDSFSCLQLPMPGTVDLWTSGVSTACLFSAPMVLVHVGHLGLRNRSSLGRVALQRSKVEGARSPFLRSVQAVRDLSLNPCPLRRRVIVPVCSSNRLLISIPLNYQSHGAGKSYILRNMSSR